MADLFHSVGFFLDSYDLFIVNLVSPIWQYQYGTSHQVGKWKTSAMAYQGSLETGTGVGRTATTLLSSVVLSTQQRTSVTSSDNSPLATLAMSSAAVSYMAMSSLLELLASS